MRSIHPLIVLSILIVFSCNEKPYQSEKNDKNNDVNLTHQDSSKTVTVINSIDSNGLTILKSVFDSQSEQDVNNSIKFFNQDSITDFVYLRNLFPIWESDSIEFYGNLKRDDISFNSFPMNSLLIIYLNNRRLARNQINLLQFEWHNKKEALEIVFKPGGIAFELNHQLCIYSIDGCNRDYNIIEIVDSIIKASLQNSYRYERIITTCKSEPFQRRVN